MYVSTKSSAVSEAYTLHRSVSTAAVVCKAVRIVAKRQMSKMSTSVRVLNNCGFANSRRAELVEVLESP